MAEQATIYKNVSMTCYKGGFRRNFTETLIDTEDPTFLNPDGKWPAPPATCPRGEIIVPQRVGHLCQIICFACKKDNPNQDGIIGTYP